MHNNLIHRPIAVTMSVIALVVLGVVAMLKLPVSLMPDIDVPQITVQASCPGMSAREVEDKYTSLLRGQLMQVDGVSSLRSESRADAGSVVLTFEPGSDMDILFIEVNEKIDRAMNSMPRDAERPKVIKAGAMDIPAFYLDICLKDSTSEQSSRFAELGRFATGVVSKRVEQLPQTAMVDMSGTTGTEIVCTPHADKLTALGITTQELEKAITENNITLEALSVADGIYRYHVHFDSQLLTKEDVARVYVKHEGRLLQLGGLCDIEERMQQPTGLVRHNGRRAVTMAVIKQNDARMEDLQASMAELLDDLRKEYPGIDFQLTRDQTELLSYTIQNLAGNLITGALLASLILFLFMRQWRVSLLVVTSIPLSLILTLLGFGAAGVSLNIISLSGLILGTGMIVDNAIIVIDNIIRRWQGGEPLATATVQGTREVFVPMLSSVLTTCSVFIPLVFLSGTAGALFFDQAAGITASLLASLVVAAAVLPVFFFNIYRRRQTADATAITKRDTRAASLPFTLYEWTLRHVLRHGKACIIAMACTVPLTAMLLWSLEKERMPMLPHHDGIMHIDWNAGISATENDRRTSRLMQGVADLTESVTTMCGTQDFMLSHTPDITQSEAVVYADTRSSKDLQQLQERIRTAVRGQYPQATVEFREAGNLFSLIFQSGEADLEIHLQDHDGRRPPLDVSRAFVDSLRARFPDAGIMPVETETDIRLTVDMERMAVHQVTYESLLSRMKSLVNQGEVMEINDGAQSVPVLLGSSRKEAEGLLAESIANSEGTPIPLSMLVTMSGKEDYKRLQAAAGGEYYNIEVHASDGEVEDIMDYCDGVTRLDNAPVTASYGGGYFSSRRLIGELAVVLCVALALLYFILAAQFESLAQPFIILMEMVADVFFVALFLWLAGMSLNIMSMIGLVVVCGIVINDSILKVDTINRLRRGGTPVLTAIIRAGHWRLRPIIMTSLTTMLAVVPSLFQDDMGSALQRPLSVTLIVGMACGTLVSLFIIPLLYLIIYKRRRR